MSVLAVLDPAVSVLHDALEQVAAVLPGPLAARLSLAIVLITCALRLLLVPLVLRSWRAQQQRLTLAPQITALRNKHRGDPSTLASAVSDLHREAGVSPFAGTGSALLMLPAFSALYRMVHLLGDPLSTHWLPLLSTGPEPVLLFVALMAALAVLAHLSSRKLEGPLRALPYGTVAFAAVAPVAVGVYLLSTTAWTVAERAVLPRLG